MRTIDHIYQRVQCVYAYIFARESLMWWNDMLITFGLRGIGINNSENRLISGEKYIIEKYIKNANPCIVDIGAHHGQTAELIKKVLPKARVYSFEPNPKSYVKLQESALKYKYETYNLAMSSKQGVLTLYDINNEQGSEFASIYREAAGTGDKNIYRYKVQATTIDECIKRKLIPSKIDMLKIDVEGNELAVLSGASRALNSKSIKFIQFEFNMMNIFSRKYMHDFIRILNLYDLYRVLPHGVLPIKEGGILSSEIFAYQNVIAILKK